MYCTAGEELVDAVTVIGDATVAFGVGVQTVTVVVLVGAQLAVVTEDMVPGSVVVPDELVLPVLPVPGEDGVLPTISGEGLVLPPVPDALLAAVASIPRPHPDNKRQSDKTARGTAATPLQRTSFRIIHYSCESASGQKP